MSRSTMLIIVGLILALSGPPLLWPRPVSPGPAGAWRHDVDRSVFREVGARSAYAAVARLVRDGTTEHGGSGVLIAPRWVLTAAHVVDGWRPGSDYRWEWGGVTAAFDTVILHPSYAGAPSVADRVDLALVRLGRAVESVAPARLHEDGLELGRRVAIVGFGTAQPANTLGGAGDQTPPGEKYGGFNVIDSVTAFRAFFDMDAPSDARWNALGDGKADSLEYVPLGGDSGGAAFAQFDAGWEVVAIMGSITLDVPALMDHGWYGQVGWLNRVTPHIGWVRDEVGEPTDVPPTLGAVAGCASAASAVDLSQAEAMLVFLDQWARGEDVSSETDALMALHGTGLVVQQMNLARRVTPNQYQALLQALATGTAPTIQPVDTTARARRGVQGLEVDVAGLLAWGRDHVDALRAGLQLLAARPLGDAACRRALAHLPASVTLAPTFAVVMGGRAGAAALEGGHLYVDALISTRLALDAGRTTLDPDRVEAFFAHEAHHLGLSQIIGTGRSTLHLDEPEAYAFQVLTLLALEGSATYLVDWEGDTSKGAAQADFADLLAQGPALLEEVGSILSTVLEEPVGTRSRFEAVTASMVGNRYHAAGALMVAEIDAHLGRTCLMDAIRDPRGLVAAFNKTVRTGYSAPPFRFADSLAARLVAMGGNESPPRVMGQRCDGA